MGWGSHLLVLERPFGDPLKFFASEMGEANCPMLGMLVQTFVQFCYFQVSVHSVVLVEQRTDCL